MLYLMHWESAQAGPNMQVRHTGSPQFPAGVNAATQFFSLCQACDRLATCPAGTLPFHFNVSWDEPPEEKGFYNINAKIISACLDIT